MPCVGKMFGAPQVLPKAARTVNITEMSVKTNGPLKQTRQPSLWNRIRKKQKALFLPWMMLIQKLKNSFNLNPLDFESFDLTEEYEMAQLPLNRVPLMSLDEKRKLEKLLHLAPLLLQKCPLHCGSRICCSLLQAFCGLRMSNWHPPCYDLNI